MMQSDSDASDPSDHWTIPGTEETAFLGQSGGLLRRFQAGPGRSRANG